VAVVTPILAVAVNLFVPKGEIWAHLATTVLPRYVANSLWLMLGVGIGTAVIGVGTAWLVTVTRLPGRRVLEWALLLPLAMPAYVVGYTYTGLLEFAGPVQSGLRAGFGWSRADYWFPEIRSLGGAIFVLTMVLYPYVYLLARAAFTDMSVCALEVSRTLGRSTWATFRTVAVPMARPAIIGGVALALMEALSDFGTVQYFAVDTFTAGIYRTWFGLGEPSAAAQLATILLGFVLVLLVIERRSRGEARFTHASRYYRRLPEFPLGPVARVAGFLACLAPILFGFAVPVLTLVAWILAPGGMPADTAFLSLAGASLGFAAVAAAITVGVAVALAYAVRLRPVPWLIAAVRLGTLGYAVPGAVVAVGILLPLAWIDNQVDGFTRRVFGFATGLLLSGTVFALLYAYSVRFLAVAFNAVEASLLRVTPSMDGAARLLGAGTGETLRRVHVPLIGGGILTAGMLVFVDVLKELPATLIMRPFNLDTLAVRTYQLAQDERLAEAGLPALLIVAVGVLPVILLSRAIARSRPGHAQG